MGAGDGGRVWKWRVREEGRESWEQLWSLFEGRKEEKVVINSLLFIPPSHSFCLSLFLIIEAELKSHIPLSHGIKYVGTGRQPNDVRTHALPWHIHWAILQLVVEVTGKDQWSDKKKKRVMGSCSGTHSLSISSWCTFTHVHKCCMKTHKTILFQVDRDKSFAVRRRKQRSGRD